MNPTTPLGPRGRRQVSFYSEQELRRLGHTSMQQETFEPFRLRVVAHAWEGTFARAGRIKPLKE